MPVYFIRAGEDGPVKIGVARSIERRLRGLQTAHYELLRLVRQINGGRVTEAWLHNRFESHRTRGEWFRWADEMADIVPPPESVLTARSVAQESRGVRGRTFALLAAIERAGGVKSLADHLGIRPQAVSQWSQVPIERALDVERASGVSRKLLRPDFYDVPEAA